MICEFEIGVDNQVKQTETYNLEYKGAFHYGSSLLTYIRSLVGMANNEGGEIIFGIKNQPRELLGLQNDKFDKCDPTKINQILIEHFSPMIFWGMEKVTIHSLEFGRVWVEQSKFKPVVCTRNHSDILREGAIYYRYVGETREIGYSELNSILNKEKEKEKLLWMNLVKKVGEIGPHNVQLIDSFKGEIHTGDQKIILDKAVAGQFKIIQEGNFSESEGAPTLKLVGNITEVENVTFVLKTDLAYPDRFDHIKERFKINIHQFKAVLWKLNIRGDPKYHTEISSGKSSTIHKYSKEFSDRIAALFSANPSWLKESVTEYKEFAKGVKKERKHNLI